MPCGIDESMNKYRSKRQTRPGAGRSMPVRPQRASGLSAQTVGIVLGSSGTHTTLLNAYLTAAHLAVGLLVMALGLEDIVLNGPTRPMIIPFAGAYMSSAVVFFAVMRESRPIVLSWLLGLADVVMLSTLNNLTYLDLGGGADLTFSMFASALFLLYAGYGNPRLSLAVSGLTIAIFALTSPLFASAWDSDAIVFASIGALLLQATVAGVAYKIAIEVRNATTRKTIERLQRIDFAVSMHRTIAGAGDD